jgi:hypothetical protein
MARKEPGRSSTGHRSSSLPSWLAP